MFDRKSILLIDDDQDLVDAIQLRFDAAGYTTMVAQTLESGVHLARTERPHAIVMDVRMRDGSGLDAISTLKNDPQTGDIPIVMLSGSLGSEQTALERGARFFVRKPYQGKQVLLAVESAIQETQTFNK